MAGSGRVLHHSPHAHLWLDGADGLDDQGGSPRTSWGERSLDVLPSPTSSAKSGQRLTPCLLGKSSDARHMHVAQLHLQSDEAPLGARQPRTWRVACGRVVRLLLADAEHGRCLVVSHVEKGPSLHLPGRDMKPEMAGLLPARGSPRRVPAGQPDWVAYLPRVVRKGQIVRVIQRLHMLSEVYFTVWRVSVKGWPVRERIELPHLIHRTGHRVYHTTGFDREEIIDLCVRINSVERDVTPRNGRRASDFSNR